MMQKSAQATHPRPQLARNQWINLNGPWGFAYDDARRGADDHWYERSEPYTRTITVPFPPESPASGVGDTSYHPVVWYRRAFTDPRTDPDQRLLLHLGAVDYQAEVWVNGRRVASHAGGHTPFSADITAALQPDGAQTVVVRAEDNPFDLAQPRGKQDWYEEPHKIWYQRTTGIWQTVWLEPIAPTHIARVRWTSDLPRGVLAFRVTLNREDTRPLQLRVRLRLHGKELSGDTSPLHGSEIQRGLALDGLMAGIERVLWSPEHPNLIDATLTLLDGDRVVDEAYSYVGLRSVGVSRGRFTLNGSPYYLRLALEQGYWPASHLAAPSDEALRRDVELAKELGFNGVRMHQKVEDPRFLYWCDRLGLLVWGEMPSAYVFSTSAMERTTREWLDVVARDYNHPCIVTWVVLNESWGVPNLADDPAQRHYVQALYHQLKALDPTRPVIGNDGWEHLVGDIYGVHDYTPDAATLRERYGSAEAVERTLRDVQPHHHSVLLSEQRRQGEPIMITEFGGLSYQPGRTGAWFGYGIVSGPDDFLVRYRALVDAILDSPAIAGFCYTQLTDTGQETNGLLTAERVPKLDPSSLRAITERPSAAIPGDVMDQIQAAQGVSPFAAARVDLA